MDNLANADLCQRYGEWNRGGGRTLDDLFFDDENCRWVVSRYDIAMRIFEQRGDDPTVNGPVSPFSGGPTDGDDLFTQAQESLLRYIFFQRSPDWERLRRVLMQELSVGATSAMLPGLTDLARETLATACGNGGMEVVECFARPFIFRSLFDLIGAPQPQWAALKSLVESSRSVFELKTTTRENRVAFMAFAGLGRAVEKLLFRDPPVEAPVMRGIRRAVEDGVWTREEAVSQMAVLVIGGLNSPITAISAMFHNLATTPAAWKAAKAGELSADAIIQETLRLGPPHLVIPKTVFERMEFGDVVLEAGQRVLILLGRINRDPAVFADPNRFDPWRPRKRNLAFGAGRHKCVGKHLALFQLEAVLNAALERFDTLELAAPPEWADSVHGEKVFGRIELRF